MTLSQTPTDLQSDPRGFLSYFYGSAGVGKTTFAAQIPDHYFICTDPGQEGVQVVGQPCMTWEEFLHICRDLVEAKNAGFPAQRKIEVVVIDVFDYLYSMAGTWLCANETFMVGGKRDNYSKIADVPYGGGYVRCNELVFDKVRKLRLAGFGVVLLGHAKEKVIKWKGQDIPVIGPNMSGSGREVLTQQCGVIGYMTREETIQRNDEGSLVKEETGRYIYFQPSMERVAKHRLANFPEKMSNPMDAGWNEYCKVYAEVYAARQQQLVKD